MVKVRLHGTPEEVKKLADYLEGLSPIVKVLSRSDGYADRGKSSYVRVYMDVELKDELKPVETIKKTDRQGKFYAHTIPRKGESTVCEKCSDLSDFEWN